MISMININKNKLKKVLKFALFNQKNENHQITSSSVNQQHQAV
jgi:hypothetical protein